MKPGPSLPAQGDSEQKKKDLGLSPRRGLDLGGTGMKELAGKAAERPGAQGLFWCEG